MTAISVRNVWQEYGDKVVLERVSLEIAPRSFCTVAGPSGCGKSTFLRLLLSQETPSRGEIFVGGEPIVPEPMPDRGVVFQRYSVFPHLTVLDNVVIGLEFEEAPLLGRLFGTKRKQAEEEACDVLEKVGLIAERNRHPHELSGGMRQRLSIAQTLIKRPRLLLLDEPFGALDPGTRSAMHELVTKLFEENDMTVLMVTHDLQEAFKLGTRLLVFDKTRVDAQAPERYGANVTYDLPLDRSGPSPPEALEPALRAAV